MADPDAPPIVVTGPAQAQSKTHPLLFTVADFGEQLPRNCSLVFV